MSREDYAQSSIDMSSQQWRPKVRQELITVLTTSPARRVLACKRRSTIAITAMWSESLWGLHKTVLATNVEESDRAMAADGMTKALVSLPPR